MVGNYPVITLCGSTRFKDAFMEAQRRLTLEGYIVISVGLFGHSGDNEVWENMPEGTVTRTKAMLDDMHKRKIDMADEIYVLNVNDYIGQSTQGEIAYARAHGKIVRFLEPHVEDMEPEVQRSGSNVYGASQGPRPTESAYADSVPAAQRSWEDAYEVGDDYAALEAIMRQAVQGVGVAGAGVYSPDDATARMIAYQNDDDAEFTAQGAGEDAYEAGGTGPRPTESAYADSVPAAQRPWEDVYEAGETGPRPTESAYADSVPAAQRSGEDAYEAGDDDYEWACSVRDGLKENFYALIGDDDLTDEDRIDLMTRMIRMKETTARWLLEQWRGQDAEALAQEQAQQAAGTSDVDPARQSVQAAVGAQEPHASYTVHLSPDEEEQDPAQAKAYYALQMLQDGYDVGNTAYFIGEDEAFVRAVMVQYGITDEDLIRFQQH